MPELPPKAEVLDALEKAVAPSAAAAGMVLGVGLLIFLLLSMAIKFDWRRAAAPLAVLALAAALAAGNHYRHAFPFMLLPESEAKWWHWAWPALGVILLAEFLARIPWVNPGLGYLLRIVAFAVGPCYLIQTIWADQTRPPDEVWWIPGLLGMWVILTELGEEAPGGSLPAALTVVAGGAATLLLHQKTLGLADAATFIFCALAVVTVISFATQANGSSAAGVAAILIALLLLLSQTITVTPLPKWILRLVVFAPCLLGVFLLPGIRNLNEHRFATPMKVLLVAIPVIAAVVWAMRVAPLEFGGEEQW